MSYFYVVILSFMVYLSLLNNHTVMTISIFSGRFFMSPVGIFSLIIHITCRPVQFDFSCHLKVCQV